MISRVLLFGNDIGMPQSLRHIPPGIVCGIVAAEIRPQEHRALRDLAEKFHLPFIIQPRVSSPEYPAFVEKVRQLNPDLIFVNAYSMLLQPEILAIPRYGAINVHMALLPQYRGCNPIQWAILNDENITGVTMHYMDAHFDTGDIIAQHRVPMFIYDTWQDVMARIIVETDKMFEKEVPKLLAVTNTRQPQDETRARYWPRRHPEDGIFSWQQSVHHIYNLIRALVKPLPGAFYLDKSGRRVVLDEYLTIPQVTALKYGQASGQALKDERILIKLSDSSNLENNTNVFFNIYSLKDNRLLGSCELRDINNNRSNSELKITLNKNDKQYSSYLKEATNLALKFAFNDLLLEHVYLQLTDTDQETVQLYTKAGFKKEGVLREAAHINGKYVNVAVMGILRDEHEP